MTHFNNNFSNVKELNNIFVGTPPYPMIVLDNFLPNDMITGLEKECTSINEKYWSEFTRRGSYMKECNTLEHAPIASEFVNQMHSQQCMNWLIKVTGIKDLIPDPYLVGAGYSRSFSGDCLKIHTDFNWNDKIKLHRMLSLIVYLNTDWKEEYGGDLQFKDFNNNKIVQKISPLFNRAILWRYHKRGFHGYPDPINCPHNISRNTFRLFFYVSNSSHNDDDLPHRSLYWYDTEFNEPYDILSHK